MWTESFKDSDVEAECVLVNCSCVICVMKVLLLFYKVI